MSRYDRSRSDYVPNWMCPEMACVPKWSCPETSGAPSTEQWRLVPDSNEPIFINTAVAKLYSHFKVCNVNKVAIFYEIVLIPLVCCSFQCTLSLCWQCVYVHGVTAGQSELNEARATNKRTNTVPSRDLLKFIYRLSLCVYPVQHSIE